MTYSEFVLPSGNLFSSGYVLVKKLGTKLRRHLIITHPADTRDVAVVVEALKNINVYGREETLAGHVMAAAICKSGLVVLGLESPEYIHMSHISSMLGEQDNQSACTITIASAVRDYRFVCENSTDYISWDMAVRNAFHSRNTDVTVTGTGLRDIPAKLGRSLSIKSLTRRGRSASRTRNSSSTEVVSEEEMARRMALIENLPGTTTSVPLGQSGVERVTATRTSMSSTTRQTLEDVNREMRGVSALRGLSRSASRGREFTSLKKDVGGSNATVNAAAAALSAEAKTLGTNSTSQSGTSFLSRLSRSKSRSARGPRDPAQSTSILERSKSISKRLFSKGQDVKDEAKGVMAAKKLESTLTGNSNEPIDLDDIKDVAKGGMVHVSSESRTASMDPLKTLKVITHTVTRTLSGGTSTPATAA